MGGASEVTQEVGEWKRGTHWALFELREWVVQIRPSLKQEGFLLPPEGVTCFLSDLEVLLRKLRLRETSGLSVPLST